MRIEKKGFLGVEKDIFVFGEFKGATYGEKRAEDFENYKSYKNTISHEKILNHIESLEALCYMPKVNYDVLSGERLPAPGYYRDGDFIFPTDYPYYMKKYEIGVPPEYEEYLKKIID